MHSGKTLGTGLTIKAIMPHEALALLAVAPDPSWRQFPAYSHVAARDAGAESRYVTVSQGGEPIALANIRIKRLPLVRAGLAMIAQGPVMLAGFEERRSEALAVLRRDIAECEKLTLRINPPVAVIPGSRETAPAGFSDIADTAYNTLLIDLSADEETLRANLDGKWRTDLRRGEKSNVTITRSNARGDFLKFQPILAELGRGKGFVPPQDAAFFADVADLAEVPEDITIHLAWAEDRVIGGHIGAFSGNMAVYLLGAASAEGRDLRAAFLLQWEAIRYAKQKGLGWYDLGGADEVENPHVFRFKKRMGSEVYTGANMIEAKAPWPRGAIVSVAERIYERVRG